MSDLAKRTKLVREFERISLPDYDAIKACRQPTSGPPRRT